LTVLNLTHNEITGISDDGFKGLTNLRELRLRHNNLTQLRKEMLEKMENLNSLFVANNRIEVLHADTFEGNRMLDVIDFQRNKLKAVACGAFGILQFKQLNLVENPCVNDKSNIKDCIEEYNRLKFETPSTTIESTIDATSEHSEAISTTKTRAREHRSFNGNPGLAILTKFLLSKNYSIADFIFMLILLIFTWKILSGNDETQNGNMRVNHTQRFSHLFLETVESYGHHDDDDENNDQFPRDIQ
jgi:Leucine-rich repeat (LRR) protein